MKERIQSEPFDWSGFLQRGLFEQVLLSATSVSVTFVLLEGSSTNYPWLYLDPLLCAAAYIFAFVRVWKSCVEDAKTGAIWDDVMAHATPRMLLTDSILEPVFLLVLFVMPFLSVAAQVFLPAIALFYAVDWVWNDMFLRSMPLYYDAQNYNQEERDMCPFRPYFRRRHMLTTIMMAVSVVASIVVWIYALHESRGGALATGLIAIAIMTITEGIIEPWLNAAFYQDIDEDEHGDAAVSLVPVAGALAADQDLITTLERIHEEAFPPEERVISVAEMAASSGTDASWLLAINYRDRPVGYAYIKVDLENAAAQAWYLAIDKEWRGRGIGATALRRLLEYIAIGPQAIRLLVLESRTPRPDAPLDDEDVIRLRFYRKQGAWRAGGIDYRLPAADDPTKSVRYDILFFPLAQPIELHHVVNVVRALAHEDQDENDSRRKALERSFERLFLAPPLNTPPASRDE